MNREVHVWFWEGLAVRSRGATQLNGFFVAIFSSLFLSKFTFSEDFVNPIEHVTLVTKLVNHLEGTLEYLHCV